MDNQYFKDTLIADSEDLEYFLRQPPSERQLSLELRGVLAETALTGLLRYPWHLLKPVIALQIKQLLHDFDATEQVDVGPPRPLPFGDTLEGCYEVLLGYLDNLSNAPFTIQRLCELVLEPQKQYARLDKVVVAIEKILMVVSTVSVCKNLPDRPCLAELQQVNENPKKVLNKLPGDGCLPFSVRPFGAVPGSVQSQETENMHQVTSVDNVGHDSGVVNSMMLIVNSPGEKAMSTD